MKILRFCLKFINHDNKRCTKIVIEICCDKSMEWVQKSGQEGHKAHANWEAHHALWEGHLHETIISIASEFLKNHNDEFHSYHFVKKNICCEKSIVNLDDEPGFEKDMHLKEIKYISTMNKKFCKGKITDGKHWTEIFKYEKFFHKLDLWLDAENHKLVPKCYYSYPEHIATHVSKEHMNITSYPEQKHSESLSLSVGGDHGKKKYKNKLFGEREVNDRLKKENDRLQYENNKLKSHSNLKGGDYSWNEMGRRGSNQYETKKYDDEMGRRGSNQYETKKYDDEMGRRGSNQYETKKYDDKDGHHDDMKGGHDEFGGPGSGRRPTHHNNDDQYGGKRGSKVGHAFHGNQYTSQHAKINKNKQK